ncbi:hypothetical protein [Achromobacter phage kwar_LB4]|nr:hypothetical protein [Achromobacter phage kwar_LB4]
MNSCITPSGPETASTLSTFMTGCAGPLPTRLVRPRSPLSSAVARALVRVLSLR